MCLIRLVYYTMVGFNKLEIRVSTKSTILCTPACHIYHDYAYSYGNPVWADKDAEVLIIEASHDCVETYAGTYKESNDVIMALADSDFAKMIIWMCEQYKAAHDKVEDIDIDSQHEPLKAVLNGLAGLGNEVKMVNGVLTIKAK